MILQLSSGQGPAECELAVGKLLHALKKEFPSIQVLEAYPGKWANCYHSVQISSKTDLSFLEGTIKWICQSPYRPRHKRKNWFVDISICAEAAVQEYDKELVRFETFRSSGKGGQHVNKVETGVRVIYTPLNLAVVATEARSQQMNKRIALNRLCQILATYNAQGIAQVKSLNRLEHYRIERGNPVRVYEGEDFLIVK